MAAPDLRLRTPTGTGANRSTQSANGSRASRRGKTKSFLRRKDKGEPEAPPVGRRRPLRTRSRKKDVDTEWPSHGSLNGTLYMTNSNPTATRYQTIDYRGHPCSGSYPLGNIFVD